MCEQYQAKYQEKKLKQKSNIFPKIHLAKILQGLLSICAKRYILSPEALDRY